MRPAGASFLRHRAEQRHLLWQFVRRDFEQRYVGSAGGWLWSLIHPLVLMLSWIFVFQICLRTPAPQNLTANYTMYLICGFLPWMLFQETVSRSSNILLEHQNLITKTIFPSEILPVAVFCSNLISHAIAISIALLLLIFWENHFSIQIYWLPVYILATGLFAIGLSWIVASLQVYLRDTAQAVSVLLTVWFWVTPIFIDETMIPEGLRFLVRFNPLALLVAGYRERLLLASWPSPADLLFALLPGLVLFVAGGLVFRHLKKGFADVL
jgi:ABC-type polysaccharide/polyol phosphate export permease